ncbi:cyclin-J18-like isoform X2 [Typha latifolia]|uniref:cyclin-J18-like isoform X2 n=1 Tax=Typha latifolia TaxID=4733 RepID=UPI003C2CC135
MGVEIWSSSSVSLTPSLRHQLLEFLLHASLQLQLRPIVKYTALAFFADRFFPSFQKRECRLADSWLLRPMRASNLQLFALVSIWISSKIHDSGPLSVKSLKSLGDKLISDQHFTSRDFVQAELIFMEVLAYDIGASSIPFVYLEDLYIQFRELSKMADLMNFDVCMEVMDLLYETEETSVLFNSPCSLAASTLITAYVISVPKQRWEFPILPWVKFVTSYDEEEIGEIVVNILMHVLQPEGMKQKTN